MRQLADTRCAAAGAVVTWPLPCLQPLPKELFAEDFEHLYKQDFPREGSNETPVHPAKDFVWKDYCPRAFRCAQLVACDGRRSVQPDATGTGGTRYRAAHGLRSCAMRWASAAQLVEQ